MKINLKNQKTIHFLALLFSFLLFFMQQNSGYSQCASINCDGTTTSGLYPSAIGRYTSATGNYSFAGGLFSESSGQSSFSFGNRAKALGGSSIALGQFINVNASTSIGIGYGYDIDNPFVNNIPWSLMIGIGSTKPTFFVGESIGVNSTGKIGIGNVTSPQAKLHIRADADEDASLLLEPTSANKSAVIMLGENHQIAARADNDLLFTSSESAGFAFENGSFRVGTAEQPQQISLHGSINAEGLLATAFGEGNSASGNYSFVAGENSIANGRSSFSLGQRTNVYENYALGIGRYLEVYGSSSMAIGRFLKTLSPDAMVIGYGFSETETLDNNIDRSLMIGFESTKPTFFVGPSNGINRTGRIGIGNVTDPQAKLHIRADADEDASLLLEASAGGQAKLMLSESHEIAYETDENLHLRTAQSKAFVFHQGDIFIEDIQSGIIMRSPNGQCWRGRVNDQGLLAFEQTECPTAATALPEHGRENHLMRVFPNPASKQLEVVAEGINGSFTLRLISATGQLMLEKQSGKTHTQLNIQNLSSGTYLLVLEQDGKMKDSVKVLVE
jgi:hypothetical protein